MTDINLVTEIISDKERLYRAAHKEEPDNSKNPHLLQPVQNSNGNDEDYISGAEKRFRDTHKDEFYGRRANPQLLSRGKTPGEVVRDAVGTHGYMSNAERRYRARHMHARAMRETQGENISRRKHGHTVPSVSKRRSMRRKWHKIKHKLKNKVKKSTTKKVGKHRNLPVPVLILNRFAKFFLICVALSSLSAFLLDRGFMVADDWEMMRDLSVMVGIYIVINVFLFKKKLRHTRSRTRYYRTNYIAYSIFAVLNLIMCLLSHMGGYYQSIYTWLFSITDFLQYSHLEIPKFLSACAFHALMYFAIAVITRIRFRMRHIKNSRGY